MAEALSHADIKAPFVPLVGNVSRALRKARRPRFREQLVAQVTGRVRWRESVIWMAQDGVTEIWEIGAGKALSGMVRRIDKSLETRAVGGPEDVLAATAALRG